MREAALGGNQGESARLFVRRGLRTVLAITGLAVLILALRPVVKGNAPVCNCRSSSACHAPSGGTGEICAVDCVPNGGANTGVCSVP